jgi:hypothetical protein
LVKGNTFTLFSAGSRVGNFSGYSLPPLALGLVWDTSKLGLDGTISVQSVPTFTSVVVQNGSVVVSGSGGTAGQQYYVLSSTNLASPAAHLWPSIATNTFDADGNFSITNPVGSAPQRFFNLVVPSP